MTDKPVDTLIDFYNLRLEPDFSDTARKVLKKRDRGRLKRFFLKYAPHVLYTKRDFDAIGNSSDCTEKFDAFLGGKVSYEELRKTIEQTAENPKLFSSNVPKNTVLCAAYSGFTVKHNYLPDLRLENYQKQKGQDWFDSDDLKAFMEEYLWIHELIDRWSKGEWLFDDQKRIEKLYKDLLKAKLDNSSGPLEVDYGEWSKSFVQRPGRVSRTQLTFRQSENYPLFISWHGIGIYQIGENLYEGMLSIVTGKTEIHRCILEDCNRIFRESSRGGKEKIYCSQSCRKKAYKRRKS